jgi:putative transposase
MVEAPGFSPAKVAWTMERFSAGQHKAPQEIRTFFVTASTWGRRQIFRADPLAQLFMRTLDEYRRAGKFLLHEFVLMPDHFHLIITPNYEIPLERALQFIKGGFSYRVKKEMKSNLEVWSTGFSEHRIKDQHDYEHHREYVWSNPVRAGLSTAAADYPYSSAAGQVALDPAPPGLKPVSSSSAVPPG